MKILNLILQFIFIRLVYIEFTLEDNEDEKVKATVIKISEPKKVNTLHRSYGIMVFKIPFTDTFLYERILIPFTNIQKILNEKIKKYKPIKRNCTNCLFYISKNNTCGANRAMSNLNSFPFKKEMSCFNSRE